MAKHSVPKRKTSTKRGKLRYGSFKTKVLKKLSGMSQYTKCSNCGAARLSHAVCPECGQYRGRQVIDKQKKVDKITKIKA